MKREIILNKFKASHEELLIYYGTATLGNIVRAPEGKWDMTEHMIHLTKSMIPLSGILKKPKFIVRWAFGRPNRPSRTYEQLVQRYRERLAQNSTDAPSPFVPKSGESREREAVISRYKKEMKTLENACAKWKEENMDSYILPHPLLGKLTLREMMFFMDHHTQHHLAIMKRNAESDSIR